jgi:hypothetical protein
MEKRRFLDFVGEIIMYSAVAVYVRDAFMKTSHNSRQGMALFQTLHIK